MLKSSALPAKLCLVLLGAIFLGSPYFIHAAHPKYSYIGDEWGFFGLANAVTGAWFFKNPLSGGVFINNPMLTQMIQAFFMMILGSDVWAWKAASLIPICFSVLLIFIWTRLWFDELTAVAAAFVLAASSYLWSFSLVGYTHQFGIAHILLLHVLIGKLVKGGRLRYSLWGPPLVGIVAGLSFFEYGGLVFPLILLPYAIFITPRRGDTTLRLPFLAVIIVGILTAIPGLLNATYRDNVFGLASFSNHPLTISDRIGNGVGYLLSFMWMNKNSHYAYGPYVDAISRIGVILGTLMCLFFVARRTQSSEGRDRNFGAFIILTSTLLAAFAYGTTSPYPELPRTRGIFMVHHFAILAGVGFGAITKLLGLRARAIFFALLFSSIFMLNQIRRHQFFTLHGITPAACVIWKVQQARTAGSTASEVYIHLADSDVLAEHRSSLQHTVRLLTILLPVYIDQPVKPIEVARGASPQELGELTIDLSQIFRNGCRDLAIEELPEYAQGRSDTFTKW